MIRREVVAFPRYSLNFEATGAREAEENEGEDFGREGGDIKSHQRRRRWKRRRRFGLSLFRPGDSPFPGL